MLPAVVVSPLAVVVATVVVVVVVVSESVVVVVDGFVVSLFTFGASSSRKDAIHTNGEFQLMVHSFTDQASTLSK